MSDYTIEAQLRTETGKGIAKRMRRAGRVPIIVYGGGIELPLSIETRGVLKMMHEEHFHIAVININVGNDSHTVILRAVQWHPIRDEPLHIDFLRVQSDSVVNLNVPINAINTDKCPGIIAGGVLEMIRHDVEVLARVDAIPDAIEVDCSALNIGDSVHVNNLSLPEGISIPHGVDFTILTMASPTKGIADDTEEEIVTEEE
ncbi:MAG: 50S ribosomal protein L25/general stress protein Ctc [Mariprofundales bacterium]